MSAEGRNQFTFYRSYYTSLRKLPKRSVANLFLAICAYALDAEEPDLSKDEIADACFDLIRPTLDKGRNKAQNRMNKPYPDEEQSENKSKTKSNKLKPNRTEGEKEREKEGEREEERERDYHPPTPFLGAVPDDDDGGNTLQAARLSHSIDALEEQWRATGGSINAASYDAMERLLADYDEQDIIEAMKTAHRYGKGGSWAYVETVLKNKRDGVCKTLPAKNTTGAANTGESVFARLAREHAGL